MGRSYRLNVDDLSNNHPEQCMIKCTGLNQRKN